MISVQISDSVLIGSIIVALVLCIAAAVAWFLSRKPPKRKRGAPEPKAGPSQMMEPLPEVPAEEPPQPIPFAPEVPPIAEEGPSIAAKSKDLRMEMMEIASRYDLTSITLATHDGLVIASSLIDPDEQAARYSALFMSGDARKDPSIRIFVIAFQKAGVISIIRPVGEPTNEQLKNIENDVRVILSRWI